jgi:hypothetical protein
MNPTIARFISYIFNPVLVLVFVPFLLLYRTTNDLYLTWSWTLYTVLFLLGITIFIIYGVQKNLFTDIDVSKREQRPLLFFVSILFGILYLVGLFLFHGPLILFIITFGIILGIVIASIINMKIKASMHVATISALILTVAIIYGGHFLLLLFLIPLVAWARVTIKRHTLQETIIGGILGILLSLCIYVSVRIFYQ